MKTSRLIFLLPFLIAPILLAAQIKHEFKVNGYGFLRKSIILSYELKLNKNYGFEIESGFNYRRRNLQVLSRNLQTKIISTCNFL